VYERWVTAVYAYTSAGTKTARLRVDDGHGNVVVSAQTCMVSN
jgi:hypothetical protein